MVVTSGGSRISFPYVAKCCAAFVERFCAPPVFPEFAQVGEWLKPTDCKSVPPSEVRRFESSPVHQSWAVGQARANEEPASESRAFLARELAVKELEIKRKFVMALVAYAVLGVLAWTTLSNETIPVFGMNVNLRDGTLLILGLFAFRAALYYWRTRIEEKREQSGEAE